MWLYCISQTLDTEKNGCRMKNAKKLPLYTSFHKIFQDNPGQISWYTLSLDPSLPQCQNEHQEIRTLSFVAPLPQSLLK